MAELPPVNRRADIAPLFGAGVVPDGAHAGLVFERYGRFWDRSVTRPGPEKPAGRALRAFVDAYNHGNGADGDRCRLLGLVQARQDAAAPAEARIEERTVTTRARLAIGMGADHPLENGLTFDRVLGVPCLPATALKGLCRAVSRMFTEDEADERLRWLGSADSWDLHPDDPRQRGAVCFLDAYPVTAPDLEVDVLTPHYKQYYDAIAKGRSSQGPVDWDAPNPVSFLTVAAGARFRIRLLCDTEAPDECRRALEWTWEHLLKGLELLGLGAKTAVGYGLMSAESRGAQRTPTSERHGHS